MNGSSQTPTEEIAERIAEASPTVLIPKLIAIDDYRKSAQSYRGRIADGHKAAMKLLGVDVDGSSKEGDEMGNISVTGDITNINPPAKSVLGKAALAAALLGSGVGGGMLASQMLQDKQPAVEQVDTNTRYELKLEGSEPILP